MSQAKDGGRGKVGGGPRNSGQSTDTSKPERATQKEKKDDRKRRAGGGRGEGSNRGRGGEEQAAGGRNAGKSRHGNNRVRREGGGMGPKEESSRAREGGHLSSGSMGAFPRPHGKEPGAPISEELQEREKMRRAVAEERRVHSEAEGGEEVAEGSKAEQVGVLSVRGYLQSTIFFLCLSQPMLEVPEEDYCYDDDGFEVRLTTNTITAHTHTLSPLCFNHSLHHTHRNMTKTLMRIWTPHPVLVWRG